MKRLSALTAAAVVLVIGLLAWMESASGEGAIVTKSDVSIPTTINFVNECNFDDGFITATGDINISVVTVENKNNLHVQGSVSFMAQAVSDSGVVYNVSFHQNIFDPIELPWTQSTRIKLVSAGSGDNFVSHVKITLNADGTVTVHEAGEFCRG